jgi:ketosteroid isomerase-like protein
MPTPEEVFNHHGQAIGNQDVDGIMADYTEDSVIITHDKDFRGLDAIRGFFQHFVDDVVPAGATFDLTKLAVEGDHVYITWNSDSPKFSVPFSTDTFYIQDGKIAFQTLGATIIEK